MPRLLLALCLLCCDIVAAQPSPWLSSLQQWLTTDDAESSLTESSLDLLSALAASPLDLNTATRDDLSQLPFLSAQQVEDIIAYTDRYRPLRTLSELQMLPSLDPATRRLLLHFVTVTASSQPVPISPNPSQPLSSLSSLLSSGRHSLLASARIPFYQRQGDRNGYLGYPLRHDLRYQFTARDRLRFGFTAAQDAGEPFFANRNRWGYDHYAYYLQLRHLGPLQQLNLGMYRVQLGMGLIMNTAFHLGKLATLQSLGRSAPILSASASRSSVGYLRGAAATLRLAPRWTVTAFASSRPLDATLNADGTARTILTDGYHRTPTELSKKSNTTLTDLGLRLSLTSPFLHGSVNGGIATVSLNVLSSHFSRPLSPLPPSSSPSTLYRLYSPSGSTFLNASLSYTYTNALLSFSGETALSRSSLATLHTLTLRLTSALSLMALHRYYSPHYAAFHAAAFSESSSVQNEHGLYLGATWTPSRRLSLRAYADYIHFPAPRYQVSTSSDAFDALLLARTLLYNKYTLESRYRFRLRQRDNPSHTLLQNHYEHRLRLRLSAPLSSLLLSTQLDAVSLSPSGSPSSRGLMLTQQAAYQSRRLHLTAGLSWFLTDDYDSRLYQYEPSILYDFSFPSFYGHGLRYFLLSRVALSSRLQCSARLSVTDYFDRPVISSGLQQIPASSQTDLLIQLHYLF